MKMPEPIIEPTTIIVASSGPSRLTRRSPFVESGFIVGDRRRRGDEDSFELAAVATLANETARLRIIAVDAHGARGERHVGSVDCANFLLVEHSNNSVRRFDGIMNE